NSTSITVIFVTFIIDKALSKTTARVMVFQLILGCAGGTPMALGGPNAHFIYVLVPVIGGFLAAGKGWRWFPGYQHAPSGWTAYSKLHWIAPILGTSLIGFGCFFVITPAQLYLVFRSEAAASPLEANNLPWYISSTFLPLAGRSMYSSLNYGLTFAPAPVLLYKYGERLRTNKVIV
ncbi:MFS multidrug transporter, partial [Penicillium vulpinum]|uniref:MFS multidrug transporter n=1 Tax=Penicillium vulpinum TaxID=29845 RepID=UPI002546EBDE